MNIWLIVSAPLWLLATLVAIGAARNISLAFMFYGAGQVKEAADKFGKASVSLCVVFIAAYVAARVMGA